MKSSRAISVLLLSAMLVGMAAGCGDTADNVPTNSSDTDTAAPESDLPKPDDTPDLPSDLRFDGQTFTFAVYENSSVHYSMLAEEQTGDTLNDAIYKRQVATEERFGITIEEGIYGDADIKSMVRSSIAAGDDAFDVANVRCTDALTYWQEGLLTSAEQLPYIDLDKDYWNRSFNDSLTLSGVQYTAIGDLSITTLDLTFILLFNKQLIKDYQLDSPYALVNSGSWTFDAMFDMMKTATRDLDGDTKMTENDAYGYTASAKQVLPNFWIAAGELSVKKDKADLPYLALNEERFIDVFNRIFEITYDDNTRYTETDNVDVPESSLRLFTENRSLFMDCSFFHVEALRDMDADFGIIPYPKFNEEQDRYYSRVSYYNAPIVSVASTELDLIGAVLEYMNYESRKTVIPAYFEIALKGKYSRDEESLEMLDLINDSRMVDIGDTTLCSTIRDGFIRTMYLENDRNLASNTASASTIITDLIDKLPK